MRIWLHLDLEGSCKTCSTKSNGQTPNELGIRKTSHLAFLFNNYLLVRKPLEAQTHGVDEKDTFVLNLAGTRERTSLIVIGISLDICWLVAWC